MIVIDKTLLRKNYFIFIVVMMLLTATLLTWMTFLRLQSFHEYHHVTAQTSVEGVAKQISHLMAEKKRQIQLFSEEHIDIIRILATNPNNDDIREHFGERLTKHFPDRFAYSIADAKGVPLFEDFDGLISELCLNDLKQFSNTNTYNPYIHPNTEGYHFDVMMPYGKNNDEGIFFVSFSADQMGPVLMSAQSAGHNLMLVYPERNDLIEIIADGARNHWVRDDYRLNTDEKSRVKTRLKVNDTRWEIIDILDPEYMHHNYRNRLIIEASIIMTIFLIIGVVAIRRLRREERQRVLAEQHKEELMGVISHELRTPASVIKSALDLVMDGDAGDISDDTKHYLRMASTNTAKLLLLVSDFLDLQKLESGHLSFNKKDLTIGVVVANAVENNRMYAQQFNASYTIENYCADVVVHCDAHRIEQVLTNLLSNAAKYGGENDTIGISQIKSGINVRIEIIDHGPGIPEEFRSQVFEKFAMANDGSQKKVKSSGLGLSIAKAIIEQHDGFIGFETVTNVGTTFYFELPIVINSESPVTDKQHA